MSVPHACPHSGGTVTKTEIYTEALKEKSDASQFKEKAKSKTKQKTIKYGAIHFRFLLRCRF